MNLLGGKARQESAHQYERYWDLDGSVDEAGH